MSNFTNLTIKQALDGLKNKDFTSVELTDAHIKASLIGSSVQILIEQGHLVLGHWQGIQFCEFDGPRKRRLIVRVTSLA